jgi:hypothetical protein
MIYQKLITMEAIYCILYVTCVWVLLRRKRRGYLWHIISSTILFLLETISLSLEITASVNTYLEAVHLAKSSTLLQGDSLASKAGNLTEAVDVAMVLCL